MKDEKILKGTKDYVNMLMNRIQDLEVDQDNKKIKEIKNGEKY